MSPLVCFCGGHGEAQDKFGRMRLLTYYCILGISEINLQPVTLSAGIVLISTYLCPKALSVVVGTPQQCAVKVACDVRKPHVPLLQSSIIKLIPLVIVDNLLWGKDLGCLKQVLDTPKY